MYEIKQLISDILRIIFPDYPSASLTADGLHSLESVYCVRKLIDHSIRLSLLLGKKGLSQMSVQSYANNMYTGNPSERQLKFFQSFHTYATTV
jgi:hypothetical protein